MKIKILPLILFIIVVPCLLYAELKPVARVNDIDLPKKEILIAGSNLGGKLFIGDILYLNINNEDVKIMVVFPMLTVSKCRLLEKKSSFLGQIPFKSPVYRKPFNKSSDQVKEKIITPALKHYKGKWKEYWNPDGDTDVIYHDQYDVTIYKNKINITIRDESGNLRDDKISDVKFNNGKLSFSLFTSFNVKYVLKIDDTGKWLQGSAVTPKDTYLIKWERIE